MNFITIEQFPHNNDVDYGCQYDKNESCSETLNDNIKCGFCSTNIDKNCHLYSNDGLEYFYLCQKCYNNNVRPCSASLKFYFIDELVQLNHNVLVHYEQDELIELYQQVKNKNQLLNIYNINPDGLDYQEIDITTNDLEI